MKTCVVCKIEKHITEYGVHKGYADNRRTMCNCCKRQKGREWHYANKQEYCYEKDKDSKLRSAYGISYKDYQSMLAMQDGRCAICGTNDTGKRKAFHVDHCHDTGEVRGLLCGNCNSGIGNLRDEVALLERAIEYLKSFEG